MTGYSWPLFVTVPECKKGNTTSEAAGWPLLKLNFPGWCLPMHTAVMCLCQTYLLGTTASPFQFQDNLIPPLTPHNQGYWLCYLLRLHVAQLHFKYLLQKKKHFIGRTELVGFLKPALDAAKLPIGLSLSRLPGPFISFPPFGWQPVRVREMGILIIITTLSQHIIICPNGRVFHNIHPLVSSSFTEHHRWNVPEEIVPSSPLLLLEAHRIRSIR